jgi:4-hydroxy-2-oxoheptanedioate aldolase
MLLVAITALFVGVGLGQNQRRQRLNPIIELLEQKKPVFGIYTPSNPRGGRGGAAATDAVIRPPGELAKMALGNHHIDFLFNGSMERGLDGPMPEFTDFVKGMVSAGALVRTPYLRLSHPLMLKIPKISTDPAKSIENISRQLNLGVSGTVFVETESAEEIRQGLAAMRFKSKGGKRPDDAGSAPAYWGMTEAQYKEKADLWPLNPNGELVSFSIVESKEGLARVNEIAAVKGIGVLFPGAGTLRSVFRNDPEGWEKAIQQVLAACKQFAVPCGYPANNPQEMEQRMKQGFSVFISGWNDDGFAAVDAGRRLAGRSVSNP